MGTRAQKGPQSSQGSSKPVPQAHDSFTLPNLKLSVSHPTFTSQNHKESHRHDQEGQNEPCGGVGPERHSECSFLGTEAGLGGLARDLFEAAGGGVGGVVKLISLTLSLTWPRASLCPPTSLPSPLPRGGGDQVGTGLKP